MIVAFEYQGKIKRVDVSKPIDISIPIQSGVSGVEAFYLPHPEFKPFKFGESILSTKNGAGCNCEVLTISPHGNGTHTECIGHISKEIHTINKFDEQFFLGLISFLIF